MHILLEPGGIIREGDERLSFGGTWQKCGHDAGKKIVCSIYRRHLGPWEAVRHALESIPDTDATTTSAYWDCECGDNFIRYAGHLYCARCGTHRQDQPDSRLREIMLSLLPK